MTKKQPQPEPPKHHWYERQPSEAPKADPEKLKMPEKVAATPEQAIRSEPAAPPSYPNVPSTMQGVPGRPQPPPRQFQPLGIPPLEIIAQQVAEQWRTPLRRTVGLHIQLSYLRAAFLAGYRYATDPTTIPATFSVVRAEATWTPYEQPEPRYWNRNTMQSEP